MKKQFGESICEVWPRPLKVIFDYCLTFSVEPEQS